MTDVVLHEKVQSVRLSQGWLQRRLGLATLHLDTTPGPVQDQRRAPRRRRGPRAWLDAEVDAGPRGPSGRRTPGSLDAAPGRTLQHLAWRGDAPAAERRTDLDLADPTFVADPYPVAGAAAGVGSRWCGTSRPGSGWR